MRRRLGLACAIVAAACGKTSVASHAPETDAAASSKASPSPTVPPVLAVTDEPSDATARRSVDVDAAVSADAGIVLPRKTIAGSPCGAASVPLCFPTRATGCCEPVATFAVCGPRRFAGVGVWECPPGTIGGRDCPPSCVPDVRGAIDAEEERQSAKNKPPAKPALPGAYAVRSHAYPSHVSFESLSHFLTLFHGDEALTTDIDHVAVEPMGRAATYCNSDGTTFLHVASRKSVAPIAHRAGCAYTVSWDVDRLSVTLVFAAKKRVTSSYK